MWMFTLAISCLTSSNLLDSWTWHSRFLCNIALYNIELYFHHQSHPKCCFCFGSVSFFFLELFLNSSPVAHCAPTDLGCSSFSIISFCVFILFMGFSRQEYWSSFAISFSMNHVLSELSTITQSWVALHGMVHSYIELHKAVIHVISLVSFLWLDR